MENRYLLQEANSKYQRHYGNSGNGSTGELIVYCSSVQQKLLPRDEKFVDCSFTPSSETVGAI